jgi:hypothetical protein
LIAAAAALGGHLILQWFVSRIQLIASRLALAPGLALPENIGTYFPFVSAARDVLLSTLFLSTVLAFAVHLWRRFAHNRWRRAFLLAGLMASFLPPQARRLTEVVFDFVPSLLLIFLACFLVTMFLRDNPVAYLASGAVLSLARSSAPLMQQGNLSWALQGGLLWAVTILGMAFLWVRSKAPQSKSSMAAGEV